MRTSRFLSIATGGTGGVYYPYGGGIAKILNDSLPDMRATAEVTSASVDNLKLIRDGRADIAFTLADTLADAVAGHGTLYGKACSGGQPRRLVFGTTRTSSRSQTRLFESVADLRRKVVSTGAPGSGTEVIAFRLLRAAGLDPDRDVTRQGLGGIGVRRRAEGWQGRCVFLERWIADGCDSGSCRTVPDISMQTTAERGSAANAAAATTAACISGSRFLPARIRASRHRCRWSVWPTCSWSTARCPTSLAYDITRTLFEKQPELAAIHPEARNLSRERAVTGSPAEYHPGAMRFFREQGSWK